MAGLYFEEFHVGQRFQHPIRRTVTETDNVLFTAMTHNPAQLHLDEEYGKTTEFGTRIVNSLFTLGLMIGISVGETTLGTTVANLGMDEVRFPKPVFHGDTLKVKTMYGLDDSGAYGIGIATAFEKQAEKKGIKLLGHDRLDPKAADYTAVLTKIKGLGPQLLYYGGDAQAGVKLVESGAQSKVLVCGADANTRMTDYTDRATCVLFR